MTRRWKKCLFVCAGLLTLLCANLVGGEGHLLPSTAALQAMAPLADAGAFKLAAHLTDMLAGSGPNDRIPVLVHLKAGASPQDLPMLRGRTDLRAYHSFPAIAGRFTPGEISRLLTSPAVAHVEWDAPVHASLDTASRFFGVTRVREAFGLTGKLDGHLDRFSTDDVVIALLDTGIDPGHIDLTGKLVDWHDFVNERSVPYDDNGHGTHVAGIAAGRGIANPLYMGVAPGAALVGLKVLDSAGSGSLSTVASALDWCVQHRQQDHIRVINLSLGSPGPSDGLDVVSEAVNAATAAGMVVVVAAGNDGPDPRTIGAPGAATGAVTVGAMADPGKGGFYLAPFSGRGPTSDGRIKPDLVGPGANIVAPKAGTRDQYVSYSGTSMAAPFVAGVAALLFAANPHLTGQEVRNLLFATAQRWGGREPNNDYGYGRVDAYAAVAQALGQSSGGGPEGPTHLHREGSLSGTGRSAEFLLPVADSHVPVAVTLVMPDWTGSADVDFDLFVYDPSGHEVASSTGIQRQETVHLFPTVAGPYRVQVRSYRGAGPFWLDVSGDLGSHVVPNLTIASPEPDARVSGDILLTATVHDDAGIAQVALAVDDGPYRDVTNSWDGQQYRATVHTANYGDGQHLLRVRATDRAGQITTATVRLQLANQAAGWQQRISQAGRVSPSNPDVWSKLVVGAIGFVDLQLDWPGDADLDLYAYAPDGAYIGRAFTNHNPERLHIDTSRYGTGTYRLRVNAYRGAATSFTLTASGYARTAYTGVAGLGGSDSYQSLPVDLLGYAWFQLDWPGSQDLDLYLRDPSGRLRARAATAANPEQITIPLDEAGSWQARVNLFDGPETPYTLQVWLPANCLQ